MKILCVHHSNGQQLKSDQKCFCLTWGYQRMNNLSLKWSTSFTSVNKTCDVMKIFWGESSQTCAKSQLFSLECLYRFLGVFSKQIKYHIVLYYYKLKTISSVMNTFLRWIIPKMSQVINLCNDKSIMLIRSSFEAKRRLS